MPKPLQTAKILALTALQLAMVGWFDYATGYEISVSVLYYVPIAYAAWYLDLRWAFWTGVASAAILTKVELAAGRSYSSGWIVFELCFLRVVVFGFVAYSCSHFRRTREEDRARIRRLEGALSVCSCCRKIKNERGDWLAIDDFLAEDQLASVKNKVCPSCARDRYARGGTG